MFHFTQTHILVLVKPLFIMTLHPSVNHLNFNILLKIDQTCTNPSRQFHTWDHLFELISRGSDTSNIKHPMFIIKMHSNDPPIWKFFYVLIFSGEIWYCRIACSQCKSTLWAYIYMLQACQFAQQTCLHIKLSLNGPVVHSWEQTTNDILCP